MKKLIKLTSYEYNNVMDKFYEESDKHLIDLDKINSAVIFDGTDFCKIHLEGCHVESLIVKTEDISEVVSNG